MFNKCPRFTKDDDFMTQKTAWEDISQYIPQNKVIWECFYGDGKSGQYLRELGFDVIHEPIDFFDNNLGDVLVSNMPYSIKKEVFTRLKELDKPFIMLVPTTTLHTKYFKELFEDDVIQLILPYKKRQFESPTKTLTPNGCSFYTCYICYKMKLPKDVILL